MIIPVILEETIEEIERKIRIAEKRAKQIQIDVADGTMTEHRTFANMEQICNLKSKAQLEIHLMVENPMHYLDRMNQNISKVCTQIETDQTGLFIKEAKRLGYKVGVSLATDTNLTDLNGFTEIVDYVQFVGVKLGNGGSKLDPLVLEKMTLFNSEHPSKEFQLDGGIHFDTVSDILKTGVNNLVIGSGLFKEPDFNQAFDKFLEAQVR